MVQSRYLIGTQKSVGKQETGNDLIGYHLGLITYYGLSFLSKSFI